MLQILAAPDHVGAYKLEGVLTEEDYDRVIADIEARLNRFDRIGIVADLTGFRDITVRAGWKDLRYSFGKMLELKRFPREALIADRHWIRTMVEWANPVIPFVQIRVFQPDESEAAVAWAGDIDPGLRPHG
ncbi:SpoIIAA family protein [Flavisphingomonas formosensis]|uniref:STAS/SEC14 domain-containing protein n=1 Tax=Flavisphingomonas formosensis TaxID=861534 RepID=UPI0012F8DE47|nr:STAS/SEC14 domain-containing protein [Sphingomonas formosensis]